ncbi:LysR substrate-binding domain-containing protein [Saccharothrix sp.]|uniref:LysR substrate-binding domain-containing protein n=1 Tax=Saccharothrix sp. TaxID=1873460 RepID=UPI002811F004|nr:LysR substrate-binding domain-containing protein [Saccharothrix sp.]
MSMDLRLMRYVVTVADEGGFQRAADRLHVAQPALSRQIGHLERTLGVDLFTRRPTALTDAGRVFVASARRILGEADRLADLTRAAGRGEFGTVRLGHVVSAAFETVPNLVDAVSRRYPGLRVETTEAWSAELAEGLRTGRFDAALSRSIPDDPDLDRLTVHREDLVVVVADRHRLSTSDTVTPADLVGSHVLLSPRHLPSWRATVLSALRPGTVVRDSRMPGWRRFDELTAETFTVVTETLGAHRPPGTTVLRFAEPPSVGLDLVWRRDSTSPALRLLGELVRERAQAMTGRG